MGREYINSYRISVKALKTATFNLDREIRQRLALDIIRKLSDEQLNSVFNFEVRNPEELMEWPGDLNDDHEQVVKKELEEANLVLYKAKFVI